jgi:hypothetical protein
VRDRMGGGAELIAGEPHAGHGDGFRDLHTPSVRP